MHSHVPDFLREEGGYIVVLLHMYIHCFVASTVPSVELGGGVFYTVGDGVTASEVLGSRLSEVLGSRLSALGGSRRLQRLLRDFFLAGPRWMGPPCPPGRGRGGPGGPFADANV